MNMMKPNTPESNGTRSSFRTELAYSKEIWVDSQCHTIVIPSQPHKVVQRMKPQTDT